MPARASLLSIFTAVALLGVFSSTTAFAQATTATLRGEVVDQADSPLAGVTLTLTSDSLQGSREIVTGEDGRFRFMALPPGSYRMDTVKEGFKTIIRPNLVLSVGRTINLKLIMELPEVGETVEVIDRRPVVDTESTTQSLTLSADFLKDLPSGRSFQDVVQFLPGVTGGSNPNISGGAMQSNQYYLDGTSTTDPVTGTFSMNFNFDAIQDLEVITAGYDARYNQGLGGTINIVTKSGGNTFEGDFNGYYESTELGGSGSQYLSVARPTFYSADLNASLGGPIVKDRFWFYLAYQYSRSVFQNQSGTDVGRDYALFPLTPRVWNSHFILMKLTAQPFARNKFTLSFRADPTDISNGLTDPTVLPEANQLWRQGGFSTSLAHEVQIGGRAVLTTTAFYQYSTIFVQPVSWKDCNERDEIGRCLDEDKQQSAIWPEFNGLQHGSYGRYDLNRRHRFNVKTDFEVGIDRLLGSHTLSAGASLEPIWESRDFGYVGNEIFVKRPVDANNDAILQTAEISDLDSYENAARYVVVNADRENEKGTIINAYVQDNWRPARGLTLNLGGRYLHSRLENNLAQAIVSSNALSWGAGVAWDPFRDGKTRISGNVAQIADPGFLVLSSYLNQSTFNYEYYAWNAEQGAWGESSTKASSPASNIRHSDFVVPRTNEFFFTVRREIARDLAAEVNMLYRRFTNLWEDDEVNVLWNEDGTNTVGFRNGSAESLYRLRTPQDARREYWSLGLVVRKQLSDNFEMLASYTFSRLTSNTAGRSYSDRTGTSPDMDNPTQRYYEDGIAGADQPHVFKISAAYDNSNVWKLSEKASMGYSLGGVVDFRSGPPLDRLQYNLWTQSFSNYVYKRGTRERLPAYVGIDLRGSLALSIAGARVDLIVQVFNLLNSLDITSADPRAVDSNGIPILGSRGGSLFAAPSSYQFPRRFEFGLRFSF